MSKILKARYFRNSLFLESELGSSLSYVWRSIWAVKQLIQNGSHIRIGDGSNVKVWGDPWLPILGDMKVHLAVLA